MRIEAYVDVLCGWGYIGKAQLGQALAHPDVRAAADGEPIEVSWRPFLIDPAAPAPSTPLDVVLDDPGIASELQACSPGLSPEQASARVGRFAAEAGLPAHWRHAWRTSSWAAHRLLQAVGAAHGARAQAAALDELYRLHFLAGADINRLEVLRSVSRRWQVDAPLIGAAEGFAPVYMEPLGPQRDALEDTTREALLLGRGLGVSSSPTFVIDDAVVLVGAQGAPALVDAVLRQLRQPRRASLPPEVRRFRAARGLLEQGDPLGCLDLIGTLRSEWGDHDGIKQLTARAMARAAMLEPARRLLEELVLSHPDDASLRELLAHTLQRMSRSGSEAEQRLASAMQG